MPARQAFTVEMTSREDRMNAISLNSSIFNGARVIGPSVTGFLVSDAMRGRVMGIWALVFGGTIPLGGLESGLLSQAVGVPWTVAAGALVCAAAGLVTWRAVRRNPPAPVKPGFRNRHHSHPIMGSPHEQD